MHTFSWSLMNTLWLYKHKRTTEESIKYINKMRIWFDSIYSRLTSFLKEASGPQDCSLWIKFCPKNLLRGYKLKIHGEIFFLYKFFKSFVYSVEKKGFCGSTSSVPRDLKFCVAVYISKTNGTSFAANSSQILLHLRPP